MVLKISFVRLLAALGEMHKKSPHLLFELRDESIVPRYHSCCQLLDPSCVQQHIAHITVGKPSVLTSRIQRFSRLFPGELHCVTLLSCTDRQLSENARQLLYPFITFQYTKIKTKFIISNLLSTVKIRHRVFCAFSDRERSFECRFIAVDRAITRAS